MTDRWGNVAEYTLTIEQTGGSGITVPGYGFLLNNELTDFNFAPAMPDVPDPNLPGPGKRPRSSMSPTIVLDHHGRPVLAVGSPGGATIITTVTQVAARVPRPGPAAGGRDRRTAALFPQRCEQPGGTRDRQTARWAPG